MKRVIVGLLTAVTVVAAGPAYALNDAFDLVVNDRGRESGCTVEVVNFSNDSGGVTGIYSCSKSWKNGVWSIKAWRMRADGRLGKYVYGSDQRVTWYPKTPQWIGNSIASPESCSLEEVEGKTLRYVIRFRLTVWNDKDNRYTGAADGILLRSCPAS